LQFKKGRSGIPVTQFLRQSSIPCAICISFAVLSSICLAQPAIQFPNNGFVNSGPWTSNQPAPSLFPTGGTFAQPNSVAPSFDPYSNGFRPSTAPSAAFPNFWNLFGAQTSQPLPLGLGPTYPINSPPLTYANQPTFGQPTFGQPTFGQPFPPAPNYPNNIYPNAAPNVLFPGTGPSAPNNNWNLQPNAYNTNPYPGGYAGNNFSANWNRWWNGAGNNLNYGTNQVVRLFQGPRIRHTWLPGTDGFNSRKDNGLESNDTDVSLVFAIPNFFGGPRPLYLIPSYSQHLWEGPSRAGTVLPGSAFSAFLDSGWESDPVQTLGIELGARVGVFSAFDAISADSIRLQGKLMGRLRLTPNSTARAGVLYIDRNKIKLLPAGGILWAPNPDTRFDIFFPEPKLSHYLATVGNSDMWWYLTGYYGGGAWTVKQTTTSES
jgi:hypothetical protein